ncbi:hypothetical protein OG21DRAFT_1517682 [Imleria badia]|nr:hypothetical protein OG21DRAFT_1517682 [Imleria badia]
MSSPPPPPPPGPPPPGPPPPGPPPTGSPPPGPPPGPPPPPSAPSSITSANYFFGFVITFVVLLLLFIGCGIGSWRRFRLVGTAWDERLQDMEGSPFSTRKRGRRRLVRPMLSETWTHPPKASTRRALSASSEQHKWESIQPISAAFVWTRSKLLTGARRPSASTAPPTPPREDDGLERQGVVATLRSYVFPRRPRCDQRPNPPPVTRPPPEAIQVVVMIAMPSPPSLTSRRPTDKPRCVGQSGVGEYQIGVVRIPWPPSGEGP